MYIFTKGLSVVLNMLFTGISVAVPCTGVQSIMVRGFWVVHTLTSHFRHIEYKKLAYTRFIDPHTVCAIKLCHSSSKVGQGNERLESIKKWAFWCSVHGMTLKQNGKLYRKSKEREKILEWELKKAMSLQTDHFYSPFTGVDVLPCFITARVR